MAVWRDRRVVRRLGRRRPPLFLRQDRRLFQQANGGRKTPQTHAERQHLGGLVISDRIYLVNQCGRTVVLQSGPEFEVLAESALDTGDEIFWPPTMGC